MTGLLKQHLRINLFLATSICTLLSEGHQSLKLRMVLTSSSPRSSRNEGGEDAGSRHPYYSNSMYHVYILECADGSLYTGITTNVERRLAEHKAGKGGHYTRAHTVVRVAYTEEYSDRSSASKREAEIKRWPRSKKLELIG